MPVTANSRPRVERQVCFIAIYPFSCMIDIDYEKLETIDIQNDAKKNAPSLLFAH